MLGVISLMASMMPEEVLIEKAQSALTEYSLGVTKEVPKAEIMMLLVHWENKGKSPEQILKETSDSEERIKFGKILDEQN